MLGEMIIMLFAGLPCICMGLLIWKKEKISLIHSYHYTKVKEQDKKAYTSMMGKGVVIIGVGTAATGIIDYITKSTGGWVCFGICFVLGFMLMSKAQKMYNGGFF